MAPNAQALSSFPWDSGDPDVPEIQAQKRPDLRSTEVSKNRLESCLFRARDLLPSECDLDRQDDDLFPTQIAAADGLLGGGLMRGEMIEIIGWRTSGRFSLVLSTLAATTRRGESAALVDLGDHLDPEAAVAAGVDLERLLWLRPEHLKQALGGAEMLLGTGFPLVVLDLGAPPIPGGRGSEAAWLRVARAAKAHRGALLVSTPYRMSGTAAQAVLEIRPSWRSRGEQSSRNGQSDDGRWQGRGQEPRLLAGLDAELELKKSRGRLQRNRRNLRSARGHLRLRFPESLVLPDLQDTACGPTAACGPSRRLQRAG